MSSLSVVEKDLLLGQGRCLVWRKMCGDWTKLPPIKCFKKALISKITLRYFSTLDFTRIFV